MKPFILEDQYQEFINKMQYPLPLPIQQDIELRRAFMGGIGACLYHPASEIKEGAGVPELSEFFHHAMKDIVAFWAQQSINYYASNN